VLLAMALVVLAVVVAGRLLDGSSGGNGGSDEGGSSGAGVGGAGAAPAEGSVEVGFARDMAAHHAQAVEMAELVRDRTDDPSVRRLATDVSLTQQGQIGRMQGWLDAWGLPLYGDDAPMAWMGHEMTGGVASMPGMATAAEVDELRDATGTAADRVFLTLMIRHHEGGSSMATAAAETATAPEVVRLAEAVRDSQAAEVTAMEDRLAALDAAA
jgi:uncharacterized protein (DUF305 family)